MVDGKTYSTTGVDQPASSPLYYRDTLHFVVNGNDFLAAAAFHRDLQGANTWMTGYVRIGFFIINGIIGYGAGVTVETKADGDFDDPNTNAQVAATIAGAAASGPFPGVEVTTTEETFNEFAKG